MADIFDKEKIMKVNDWSSVDFLEPAKAVLTEKDQKFLDWLKELVEDEYKWTHAVALLSLQGLGVPEIAECVGCAQQTVQRKQKMIAELRAEFEKDYWWA